VKRTYFLVGIAVLQIVVGSLTILGAAQPVRMSQNALVPSGAYYHYEFGILGTGRLSGNLTELQGRSFDLIVFDDPSYTSFRDGAKSAPRLFEQNGTHIVFNLNLPGSGQYHVVAVNLPARAALQVHLDLVVVGLKTSETIVAVIVLVGGLALVGAALMLSVWSSRRTRPAPNPSADPPFDPSPEPSPDRALGSSDAAQDPPDDNTRIY
jgi:hypothetical protein